MSPTTMASFTARETAPTAASVSDMLTGKVFSYPSTLLPIESPMSTIGTPASSARRAKQASYAVQQPSFSRPLDALTAATFHWSELEWYCYQEAYSYYRAGSGNEYTAIVDSAYGYDGMTIGGGCFNGKMAKEIFELAKAGKLDEARALQNRMNDLMYDIFGGKDITCWLAGQKQLMVELGVFSSNYCLCNYHVDKSYIPVIKAAMEREMAYLS